MCGRWAWEKEWMNLSVVYENSNPMFLWRWLQELSSGERGPWSTGFPCEVSVVGTHLYQCSSWRCCATLHLVSASFDEDSFKMFAHFMMGDLGAHLPILCWVFSFWAKKAWPPCPTLPIHLIFLWMTFLLFPWMKDVLKRKYLPMGRDEIKYGRNTIRHQNWQDRKLLSSGKRKIPFNRCIVSNGEYFEGDRFNHVRINI